MKHYLFALLCVSSLLLMNCEAKKVDTLLADAESADTETSRIPGWHGYNSETIGGAWEYSDGVISFDKKRGEGGDIVTDKEYENFELSLEWKISECGNSGIFWGIVESSDYMFPWMTAPEMQVLDNNCHPDAKIQTHRAGDLYDMIEAHNATLKPVGEWNAVKIISKNSNVTFSLNDTEVVSFQMHNQDWDEMVAASKFKSMSGFGKSKKGRIGLQDHNDKVWFRNISIKEI